MEKFDCVVIGSGPGGYVAAIKCAQLGAKVAIVEKYNSLGGVCLNVGCIPSKALLDSSEKYSEAKHSFTDHGIELKSLSIDWKRMMARKVKVVDENTAGVAYLMKKNKIQVFHGLAAIEAKKVVSISGKESTKIEASNIIIATGSKPSSLPGIEIDKKRVISSTEALSLPEIPKSMIVIGAGVIGIELGSVYARLGTKVKVLEYLDTALANFDGQISSEMKKILEKQGIEFNFGMKVTAVKNTGKSCEIKATDKAGKEEVFTAEYCLMAVGRKPNSTGIGLESAGVKTDARGFIIVDEKLQTNVPGIYAIGDVIGGQMLAHKAEEEGVYVAEVIHGQKPELNHGIIPNVVYTWPEVSALGLSEEDCKKQNLEYNKGVYPIKALGRSRASGDTDGFVKILSSKDDDQILGCHIISARAADMIEELVVAMSFKASAEDISRTVHPHPTFTEAIKEAATLAWSKKTINL